MTFHVRSPFRKCLYKQHFMRLKLYLNSATNPNNWLFCCSFHHKNMFTDTLPHGSDAALKATSVLFPPVNYNFQPQSVPHDKS